MSKRPISIVRKVQPRVFVSTSKNPWNESTIFANNLEIVPRKIRLDHLKCAWILEGYDCKLKKKVEIPLKFIRSWTEIDRRD